MLSFSIISFIDLLGSRWVFRVHAARCSRDKRSFAFIVEPTSAADDKDAKSGDNQHLVRGHKAALDSKTHIKQPERRRAELE